jgi:hypothetical protein
MKKVFVALSIVLCWNLIAPHRAFSESTSADLPGSDAPEMELTEAYKVITDYRDLRESCAEGDYNERRQCIRELSDASALYRTAKDVISAHNLSAGVSAGVGNLASYN